MHKDLGDSLPIHINLGVAGHMCNPGTREEEGARGSVGLSGSEFKNSMGYKDSQMDRQLDGKKVRG